MEVIRSLSEMQSRSLQWKREGAPVGLVPTMGSLHEGHLSLLDLARERAGDSGRTIVSIYVNPAQFGPNEDFANYPRDPERDLTLCRQRGAGAVFLPDDRAMYPGPNDQATPHSTFVVEEALSLGMEGDSRPGHFRGVATVVAKLFNLTLPDFAVFGEKDFQQAAVIRRMTANLNFFTEILTAPTVREPDGLALSSRNQYLGPEERRQATVLWKALQSAHETVAAHPEGTPSSRLLESLQPILRQAPLARVDYIRFFEPKTLNPVDPVRPGARMALAVFFGKTRLLDNAAL